MKALSFVILWLGCICCYELFNHDRNILGLLVCLGTNLFYYLCIYIFGKKDNKK